MDTTEQAQADLAFMKALVDETGRSQMATGVVFFAGGLLYGFQCLVEWAQLVGYLHLTNRLWLVCKLGTTIAFLIVIGVVFWVSRKTTQSGVSTRALNGAFGGAGLANIVLSCVFGLVAVRERSVTIWLLYPVALCVLFGVAWYVAFIIRRRLWLALVSVGWYLAAAWLALLVRKVPEYVLVLGFVLFVLMAVPGAVMMHTPRRSA